MQILTVRRIPLALSGFIILAVSGMHAQTTVCGSLSEVGSDRVANEGQSAGITFCRHASDLVEKPPAKGMVWQLPRHGVCLSWNASTSPNVIGYNIYRRLNSGVGKKLNLTPIRSTHCMDDLVYPGYTYRYHVRAVDSTGRESTVSNHAIVQIPPGTSY